MTAGDELKIVYWCQQGAQAGLMVCSYFVQSVPGGGSIDDDDGALIISSAIAPAIKALLSSTASYLGLVMYKPAIIPLPAPIYITEGAGAGEVAGEALPSQVSGIITQRTGLAGRQNRGRKYMPFPGEADNVSVTGGVPTVDYKNRLAALGVFLGPDAAFEDPANPGQNVVLDAIIVAGNGTVRGEVESVVPRAVWATQRRRGSYGRSNVPPF